MKVYYDYEFLEQGSGSPIYPISVGMVAEDGDEFYAIFHDAPWGLILQNNWLVENVLPSIPGTVGPDGDWALSYGDSVMPTVLLRNKLTQFLHSKHSEESPLVLWGYNCDYDHVCLAQTFGRMVDLPDWCPMLTLDIKQEKILHAPDFKFPDDPEGAHNALVDARWTKSAHEALMSYLNDQEMLG